MAAPGTPLLRVDSTGGFRVDVRIDESRAALLAPGRSVAVVLDGPGGQAERTVPGTVTEVARAVDADARAFLVKVAIEDADGLRSGMFARVRFEGPARKTLTVPIDAVVRRGQLASVFVVEKDVARLRLVQTGQEAAGRIEIAAGLDAGEPVVVRPPAGLADGRPVRPAAARVSEATTPAGGDR
jgi:RND family efflux transporter MFP subunit